MMQSLTPCCNSTWKSTSSDVVIIRGIFCSKCGKTRQQIEESKMSEKEEIKLEFGKKYVLNKENVGWGATKFPITFVYEWKEIGFIDQDTPFTFIQSDRNLISVSAERIYDLKEYHESHEASMDVWVVYNKDERPANCFIDKLTNLCSDGFIYDSEKEANENSCSGWQPKKIHITVKY